MAPNLVDCVIHWKKKLDKNSDEDTALNVIRKLSKIPITVEILEATHIGKSIRNLSKRDDIVGEKAKALLNKWRNIFVNLESARNSNEKSISNKYTVEKSTQEKTLYNHDRESSHEQKEKHKKNSFSQSSSKHSFEKHLNANHSSKSSPQLGEFEKKKFNANDANFHHFIEASVYSPIIPSGEEKRRNSHSSDSQAVSSGKRKLTTKEKVEAYMSSIPKKFKLEGHSDSPEKKKHAISADEDEMFSHSLKKERSSSSSHSKKEKKNVNSKIKKVAESETSKSKVNVQSSDGFTSSSVSFEDCLGFNDIVTVTKKKNSKSQSSTKKNDSDSVQSKNKIADKKVIWNSSDKKMTSNSSHKNVTGNSSDKKVTANSSKKVSCEVNISKKSSHPSKEKQSCSVPKKSTMFDSPKVNSPSLSAGQLSYKLYQNQSFGSSQKDTITNEDVIKFTSSRKEKTAIYSGRRICNKGVPTLIQCCYRVLIENIDMLGEMIDMPYDLLKPILEKCTPNQLLSVEKYNPHLLDETNELWEVHCKRNFKLLSLLEHETWRDVYFRGLDEQEERLKHVRANISASMLKATPVRQVKLAYINSDAKPPREVLRRQAKSGFVDSDFSLNGAKPGLCPKVNLKKAEIVPYSNASNHSFVADKRDKIKISESLHNEMPRHPPPSKGNTKSLTPVVDPTASDKDIVAMSLASKKPKVAPLMAKTLKTMKQCFRR